MAIRVILPSFNRAPPSIGGAVFFLKEPFLFHRDILQFKILSISIVISGKNNGNH